MQCANCARTLPDDVKFCLSCGSPVTPANASLAPVTDGTYQETTLAQVNDADQGMLNPADADFTFQEFGTAPRARPLTGQGRPQAGASAPYAGTTPYPLPAAPGMYPSPAAPYPLPAAPSPKRRGRSVGCIILYAFLAIILLFTGVGVAIHEIGSQVLGKVEARSDATKVAAMQLYQQVTSQPPTFQDAMNVTSSGDWATLEQARSGCTLDATGLIVRITEAKHFYYCTNAAYNFVNIAFQVQMQFISGNAGGLVFRVAPTADGASTGLYMFRVAPGGDYTLYLDKDTAAAKFLVLATGTIQINPAGGQADTLTLIAKGAVFDLYINQQFVAQAQDATLTTGIVGVLADDYESSAAMLYTNAKVWDLH